MGVLNLNKRIQDRKQKQYEEDVARLAKKVDILLGDEGYEIVGLLNMTPTGIKPIIGIKPMNDTQKEAYKLTKERESGEQLAKNILDGKSTPI